MRRRPSWPATARWPPTGTTGSCARRSACCAALCSGSRSRRAVSSPSSTRARALPGACSSWRSPPTAATCRRRDRVSPFLPSTSGISRWSTAAPAWRRASTTTSSSSDLPQDSARCGRGTRSRSGHLRPGRARLGGRDPARDRGAREPLARRADRHGGESALRRRRDRRDQNLRAAFGLAELDLFAAERGRRERRLEALWQRARARFDRERI